jgi:hypothetical protein
MMIIMGTFPFMHSRTIKRKLQLTRADNVENHPHFVFCLNFTNISNLNLMTALQKKKLLYK